jgi:hypothetical protein
MEAITKSICAEVLHGLKQVVRSQFVRWSSRGLHLGGVLLLTGVAHGADLVDPQAFSFPDGRIVMRDDRHLLIMSESVLLEYDFETDRLRPVLDMPPTASAQVSADGGFLYGLLSDFVDVNTLMCVDLDAGVLSGSWPTPGTLSVITSFRVTGDAITVMAVDNFEGGSAHPSIILLDPETLQQRQEFDGVGVYSGIAPAPRGGGKYVMVDLEQEGLLELDSETGLFTPLPWITPYGRIVDVKTGLSEIVVSYSETIRNVLLVSTPPFAMFAEQFSSRNAIQVLGADRVLLRESIFTYGNTIPSYQPTMEVPPRHPLRFSPGGGSAHRDDVIHSLDEGTSITLAIPNPYGAGVGLSFSPSDRSLYANGHLLSLPAGVETDRVENAGWIVDAIDPDGSHLHVHRTSLSGFTEIGRMEAATGQTISSLDLGEFYSRVQYSATRGEFLAEGQPRSLTVGYTDGTVVAPLGITDEVTIEFATISPDGNWVATANQGGRIRIYSFSDLLDGNLQPHVEQVWEGLRQWRGLLFSNDSQHLHAIDDHVVINLQGLEYFGAIVRRYSVPDLTLVLESAIDEGGDATSGFNAQVMAPAGILPVIVNGTVNNPSKVILLDETTLQPIREYVRDSILFLPPPAISNDGRYLLLAELNGEAVLHAIPHARPLLRVGTPTQPDSGARFFIDEGVNSVFHSSQAGLVLGWSLKIDAGDVSNSLTGRSPSDLLLDLSRDGVLDSADVIATQP